MADRTTRIRAAIDASGLSLAEIARRLVAAGYKADASYVGKIARGEVTPSVRLGIEIANIIGTDPRLIDWKQEEAKA